jgi:anti-anti-sigma regulatory factor
MAISPYHLEWLLVGSALLVRFEGVLDLASSRRLARLVASLRGTEKVVVDLAGARVTQDAALAALAPALAPRPARRVVVCGLSRHQERVLRYLGFPRDN